MSIETPEEELFANLQALVAENFPKRCRACGLEFLDATEFRSATKKVRDDHTGLKQSIDDDGTPIVELFRNCTCGSTLLETFNNRRDVTDAGARRRALFDGSLKKLDAAGVPKSVARTELLKMVRGQPNNLIQLTRQR